MNTNMAFWAANTVLFIEESLLQGFLIRGVPLYTLGGRECSTMDKPNTHSVGVAYGAGHCEWNAPGKIHFILH